MKTFGLLITILIIGCRQVDNTTDTNSSKPTENVIPTFKLIKDEIDKLDSPTVDSLFYHKYLRSQSDFCNNQYCKQFYFGGQEIKNGQIFILQKFTLNEIHYSLFLLTFDPTDSLKSIIKVASVDLTSDSDGTLISRLDSADNRVTTYEVTEWRMPDSIDPVDKKRKYCKDSVITEFTFQKNSYNLTKRDSLKVCEWRVE